MMIRVLIVEDDPMVADLNRKFIERVSEFTIEGIASNGEEALAILKENKIDLVILDIYIPKLNGMELLSEMRKLSDFGYCS
jgi:two-component system, CitB family, response regulator MalR